MGYKIKEVSEITGVSPYTLRYYEKEGILPPIVRDESGRRSYTDENLSWIEILICLKQTQMPIVEIKEIVRLSILGNETINQRKDILLKHRHKMEEQMKELQNSIEKIDKKIDFYDGRIESCD